MEYEELGNGILLPINGQKEGRKSLHEDWVSITEAELPQFDEVYTVSSTDNSHLVVGIDKDMSFLINVKELFGGDVSIRMAELTDEGICYYFSKLGEVNKALQLLGFQVSEADILEIGEYSSEYGSTSLLVKRSDGKPYWLRIADRDGTKWLNVTEANIGRNVNGKNGAKQVLRRLGL